MAELAQHNGGRLPLGSARGRRAGVDTDLGAADEPHHLLDRAGNRTGGRRAVDADVYDDRAGCRSVRSCWPIRRPRRAAGRPQSHDRRAPARDRTSRRPVGTVWS